MVFRALLLENKDVNGSTLREREDVNPGLLYSGSVLSSLDKRVAQYQHHHHFVCSLCKSGEFDSALQIGFESN